MLRRMRALEQQGLVFSRKTIKDHDLLSDPFELIMITGFSLFFWILAGDGSFLHVDQESLSLLELASEALLGNSKR